MDEDFALALRLQLEDDEGVQEIGKDGFGLVQDDVILKKGLARSPGSKSNKFASSSFNSQPMSIVDESWELIDPVPNIHDLFLQFNQAYFDGLLAGVEVKWSSRMTLCAGLCSYEGRGGLCSIRLSQPLLKLRPRRDLIQTLLHEMIHAVLFVTHNNKDHDSHGPEFHKHMHRINKQTGTKITVYHNFHDEVNNYRQHWWRCDGACQKRPPFFGIVRRAMNRAPSKNDTWWSDHMRTCGGKFTKIKEPEDYGKKKSKRKRDETSGSQNVDDIGSSLGNSKKPVGFPGTGKTLDMNGNANKISKWFKPVTEVTGDGSKERLPLDNVSKQPDVEKQDGSKKISSSVFTDSGHVLGSGTNASSTSRAAWIEKLMNNQRNSLQNKKKAVAIGRKDANPWSVNKKMDNIKQFDRKKEDVCKKVGRPIQKTNFNVGNAVITRDNKGKTSTSTITRKTENISDTFKDGVDDSEMEGNDLFQIDSPPQTTKNSEVSSPRFSETKSSNSGFTIMSRIVSECLPNDDEPVITDNKLNDNAGIKINHGGSYRNSTPIVLDDSFSPTNEPREYVSCPACPKKISVHLINIHLDECLSRGS